jgi:hypothetical protein
MKRRKQGLIQTIVQMYVYKQGVYPFRVQVDVPIYSFTDGRPPPWRHVAHPAAVPDNKVRLVC